LVCATPAAAQTAPQLPPALTDPAMAQKLTNAMQALSNVLLNMKVGEVKAALDGRSATPQEQNMTVRDVARRDDPDFDQHFHQQMAKVGPTVQRSMTTLNQALPAMMKGLAQAEKSLDRAIANLPDPTYPQR
jgi:hypothetical protein